MQRKAIMVDVDGVLITHPDPRGWSANLQRDLGISAAQLQSAFFDVHWEDVVHGRAALRERLRPVLAELSPSVTVDDLLDYWFGNDAHINHALLSELGECRSGGFEVHLATVQEHERADYLWNRLDLRRRFDGIHYAAALGAAKPAPAFYRQVELATGLTGDAIFFIDDKLANVAAARACGWAAEVWTGEQTLRMLMHAHRWPAPGPQ